MSKIFDDIMQGLDEAITYTKGEKAGAIVHDITPMDVKNIRSDLEMTQKEFSKAVGVSLPTLRHWERGDRRPQGPARVLLTLLAREPKHIIGLLQVA